MGSANRRKGLFGARAVINGVEISVSWGNVELNEIGARGPVVVTMSDLRTGRSISALTGADKTLVDGWLAEVKKAEGEADLSKLVSAQRAQGLLGATLVVNGVRLTTAWSK